MVIYVLTLRDVPVEVGMASYRSDRLLAPGRPVHIQFTRSDTESEKLSLSCIELGARYWD
jgi:hypothetical protein